jgi:thiol-disulfide isomerase/thioredoxin
MVGFGILGILIVMAIALWNMSKTLTSLEAQNLDLSTEITDLTGRVASAEAGGFAQSGTGASPVDSPSTAVDAPSTIRLATSLPPLPREGQDPALGLLLGEFGGTEYYSASELSFDPADGTPRAIFIWAHWCPYCQQEIPIVQNWAIETTAAYDHIELLSVTTSIDPTRPNPLEPYLDEGEYDFPVLVDPDGALAAHFGVTAFPFWVFTGPDGTVLARIAGLIQEEQLISILDQLEVMGAEA